MTNEIQQPETSADPWSDLERTLDRTRAEFFRAFGLAPAVRTTSPSDGTDAPFLRPARIDVTDSGTAFRIVADVPGIPKDRLDIRVRGTSVEIRGEHTKETEQKGREYVHRERTYAGFYRSLELPEAVVGTTAKAKVENGVLELELPKVTPTPSPDEVKVAVA